MKKILLSASVLALSLGLLQQASAGGTSGTQDGFYYFTYYTGSGTTSITLGSGGHWSGHWTSGITDSLCGRGWPQNNLVRNINYNAGVLSGNWHSGGEYSWTPNIETYITDFGNNSGTSFGTINSDGATYTVYRQNPSSTFSQYKDDRSGDQSIGANHTITMANHVNKWRSLGWTINLGYPCWSAESFAGPGDVNCTIW
jgi:endo-1,4-beta-xylanase